MKGMFVRKVSAAAALMVALMTLTGCLMLNLEAVRQPSTALATTEETKMGRYFSTLMKDKPGLSGFHLIEYGMEGFAARGLLIGRAEKTVDMQYFIFDPDETGKLLIQFLIHAADRGVRVRLLLDDLHNSGHDDILAALDAHPLIEVRLFNPYRIRNMGAIGRGLEMLSDFGRLDRRMHNKLLAVDNAVAIVGGRNIGNEYFQAKAESQFTDTDMIAAGPIVHELSDEFDAYWNSELAVPAPAFKAAAESAADLERMRQHLDDLEQALKDSPYGQAMVHTDLFQEVMEGRIVLTFARAKAIYDPPTKIKMNLFSSLRHSTMAQISQAIPQPVSEMLLSTPYFVPGKVGVKLFKHFRDRGVNIQILTNSLAANDVPAVHGGYMKYREDLLREGVFLYEQKASPDQRDAPRVKTPIHASMASLHAKTYVYDRKALFIGSLNLDPHSIALNTEIGLLVYSEELAGQMAEIFTRRINPMYSYAVRLIGDDQTAPASCGPAKGLVWLTERDDSPVCHTEEPEVGFWRRFVAALAAILPVEGQL